VRDAGIVSHASATRSGPRTCSDGLATHP